MLTWGERRELEGDFEGRPVRAAGSLSYLFLTFFFHLSFDLMWCTNPD